jgi:spore germination cell wall hydrolase CwlJ-like protein
MDKRTVASIYAALLVVVATLTVYFSEQPLHYMDKETTQMTQDVSKKVNPYQRDYTVLPLQSTTPEKVFNDFANGLSVEQKKQAYCLALNIYFESRGEPFVGKIGVANVSTNRVEHPSFPKTICGVVYAGSTKGGRDCAFSWTCDGRTKHVQLYKNNVIMSDNYFMWRDSAEIAVMAVRGHLEDITNGALFFYNPEFCSNTRIRVNVDFRPVKSKKDTHSCHPQWAFNGMQAGNLRPADTDYVKNGFLGNHYYLKIQTNIALN